MSSGGDSYGGASSDDERNNRRSHPASSSRRQPVDLPDDDDSEDDTRQQQQDRHNHRSSQSSRRYSKSSIKNSPREYDDEDDVDDQIDHDVRNNSNSNNNNNNNNSNSKSRNRRSSYDDEDDDDEDIKPNISTDRKRPSSNKYGSDHDSDDESDDDRHDKNSRHSKHKSFNDGSNSKKRAHSDDDYDDEEDDHVRQRRNSRHSNNDDDDEIEKDFDSRHSKKAKKEEWEVGVNEPNPYASSEDDENESKRRRDNINDDNNNNNQKNLSTVEKEIEKTKINRRRKNEPDVSVIENDCVTFLERMKKARDDDIESFRNGQPALEKIKMLRDVESMMTKVHHREYLLDNMLLAAFRSWLDRLPDGSLPNIQVRTTLLNILYDLRIDEDWVETLESSQGLGRVIHFLSKKDDHKPNKRLAEKIMMKWARPVYGMNSNFHELLYEFDKPDEGYKAGRESVAAERKAAMRTVQRIKTTEEKLRDSRKGEKSTKIMATVPRPTPFLFTTVAEGSTQMDEKEAKEMRVSRAKHKRMSRTITNLRRLSKGSGASGTKPSINGR